MDNDSKEIVLRGRDEMNLVEFPFSLLSHKIDTENTVITFTDEIKAGEKKQLVKREWTITGSPVLGLPIAFDADVWLSLLFLGKEQGFKSRKIHFSRERLCNIMSVLPGGKVYKKIREALDRFKAVSISAKKGFWDAKSKSFVDISFGIIDNYHLYREKSNAPDGALPLSFVNLNEEIFNSIQAGNIKSINLDLYFSLKSSVTKRLYRFLDKRRYKYPEKFQMSLETLAYEHLGFDRETYKFPSLIKAKLDPAHNELLIKGFLSEVGYEFKTTSPGEKVVYQFTEQPIPSEEFYKVVDAIEADPEGDETINTTDIQPRQEEENCILITLIKKGVSESVARQIVKNYPTENIKEQIEALRFRNPDDPAAMLVGAIRGGWATPTTMRQAKEAQSRQEETRQKEHARAQEEAAQMERVEAYLSGLTPEERAALEEEARERALKIAGKNVEKFYPGGVVPEHEHRGHVVELAKERITLAPGEP